MKIRAEEPRDHEAVRAVNLAAFDTPAEAGLVDALRRQALPIISLVAQLGDRIVGHILFSPVVLTGHPDLQMMGLAPMAVLPQFQRQGVGSLLVEEGLVRCRQLEICAVAVLGHPLYYPRFGFIPSTRFGIVSEYEVPEEVFMILELEPGVLAERGGTIQYHSTFGDI